MIENILEVRNMNFALFLSAIIAGLILIFYLIPFFQEYSSRFLWVYCCILPSIILVVLRNQQEFQANDYNKITFIVLASILFLPWFLQIYIIRRFMKNKKDDHIAKLKIEKIISEGISSKRIMEYFVILILPFITIGSELIDTLTMGYVLIILLLIFFRLKLFYFNLPLMLFYDIYEVTLSDGEVYHLITEKNIVIQADFDTYRKIVPLSEELKIAILHR